MTPRLSVPSVLLGAALLYGCGPSKPELEGSLSTLVDLKYDSAELVQSADEFALRFVRRREAGEDTPFKLTYNLSGTAIQNNVPMDLAQAKPEGGPRTTLARDVLDDPRTTFPDILRGTVTFQSVPVSGGKLSGELHLTFVPGKEFACGHTVFGTFEASVP